MKVLIVDDEPLVRMSLKRAFAKKGHEVEVLDDGPPAVEFWPRFNPDVVMLDVLMPGMTGPQVLEKLEGLINPKCKVILMSAYSGLSEFGDNYLFLAKPFDDIMAVVSLVEEAQKRTSQKSGSIDGK